MRSELDDNRAKGLHIVSAKLGTEKKTLSGDLTLQADALVAHSFDPNGANRIITLPAFERGRLFFLAHHGTNYVLSVVDSADGAVIEIGPGELQMLVCLGNSWSATRGVFGEAGTGHGSGLVPDPGAVDGLLRFLCDDGTWKSIASAGVIDAYKQISDGTTTAVASGLSQFKLRSSDSSVTVTVTDNDGTHGDNANLVVAPAHVDHNSLQNYDANKHVDHTAVSVTAGSGLSGGGTLAATRTLALDIAGLTATTPVLADEMAINDVSIPGNRKITLTTLNSILDHNSLVNFSSAKHVDHSAVSVTAGTGLSGGGTIDATRTITLGTIADKRILANLSGGTATPDGQTLTALLDSIIGSTRGMLMVRGASAWGSLAVGANGTFLGSNGTDPSFSTPAGAGDMLKADNLSGMSSNATSRDNIDAFGVVRVQVFTSSGTYTPNADMLYCIVKCRGGGGGGGGVKSSGGTSRNDSGAGGGQGGFSEKTLTVATVGASQTVTIGAGGTAGVGSTAAAGGAGGDTSLGVLCVGKGGSGATSVDPGVVVGAPGAGGIAGTGDFTEAGAPGQGGVVGTLTNAALTSGHGGGAGGGVGVNVAGGASSAGVAASNYGGGGGGASVNQLATSQNGGAGSAGVCYIIEFCSK